MKGFLNKKSDGLVKKWNKRWAEIEEFKFSYYSGQDKSKLVGIENLKDIERYGEDVSKDKDNTYMFQATSKEDRTKWLDAISKWAPKTSDKRSGTGSSSSSNNTTTSSTSTSTTSSGVVVTISPNEAMVEKTKLGLKEIPPSFFNSVTVESAIFSENIITQLPKEISNVKGTLRVLNLSYNKITSLPDSIGELSNLEELNLHSNQIESLPSSIGNLSKLELLWVSQNKISKLPDELSKLPKLFKLSLAHNEFTQIPDHLSSCSTITWVDITGNLLSEFPSCILKWKNLQVLEACSNNFSEVPDELGQLSNLREIRLSHNKLKTIPDSLGSLKGLQELEIADNELETLPVTLSTSIAFIQVHNNPLSKLPQEVVDKGSTAIKQYLKSSQKQDQES